MRGAGADVGFDTGRARYGRRRMSVIRPCREADRDAVRAIVNAAAEAYRGVIPADRWHEPYMAREELAAEITAGVRFWGYETSGALVGVMGIQAVGDVELIRHAYVLPERQGDGIGTALLRRLREPADRPMLVGTWAAAEWAIRFYERNGFTRVSDAERADLLRRYWTIPERQIETSVVLADDRREARAGCEPPAGPRRLGCT
jgi:GNAT superfamily N-acetyltransferase